MLLSALGDAEGAVLGLSRSVGQDVCAVVQDRHVGLQTLGFAVLVPYAWTEY